MSMYVNGKWCEMWKSYCDMSQLSAQCTYLLNLQINLLDTKKTHHSNQLGQLELELDCDNLKNKS